MHQEHLLASDGLRGQVPRQQAESGFRTASGIKDFTSQQGEGCRNCGCEHLEGTGILANLESFPAHYGRNGHMFSQYGTERGAA